MSDTFRPQVPPHLRSISEQTLDALLRIEELLQVRFAVKGDTVVIEDAAPEPAPKKGGVLARRR